MADFVLFPPQASQIAEQIDRLYFSLLAISGLMAGTLAFLIVVFCIRYRYSVRARPRGYASRKARRRWELGWTAVPALIFLGLFVWGARLYLSLQTPPGDALEIQAIGKQWMWKFQHPDGQRELNELHLPLGRPIKMVMTTQDVIHSFYVPAFRIKQDLLPGRYTSTWFTPSKTGQFRLFCAEYCGTDHSRMRGQVVVLTPNEYQNWLQRQDSEGSLAAQGKRLFGAYGCSGCHDPASTVHAPSLAGLFGRVVHLENGASVTADEAYLRNSILLPKKQVVAGYAPIMPSFEGQISEDEILKIIAYIKSLRRFPIKNIPTDSLAPKGGEGDNLSWKSP